jgi:hypothetical protein
VYYVAAMPTQTLNPITTSAKKQHKSKLALPLKKRFKMRSDKIMKYIILNNILKSAKED